ncbi:MAG TPA: winged helix-turn-helix transcriptional regulator [Hypericibacter adhaerens]|jgi:DNA-binding MarR family transcriptional regulator|nr:winged helix-turn-helix transcriptional regulator [Hypericibacter adhaerens]HWA45421.1 winged helix-turn-helix transcriptional regulator [Hypericibacter adhaerens]
MKGIMICEGRVRLFKRVDRPSRYWQAAFNIPGRKRPVVKSSRVPDLAQATAWAERTLAMLMPARKAVIDRSAAMPAFIAADFAPTIRNAKRSVERELALRILEAFDRDPALSQRELARQLGISIGVANHYIGNCVRHGLVGKSNARPSRHSRPAYILTEKGRAQKDLLVSWHVERNLTFFRELRDQYERLCRVCIDRGFRRVVLVGTGDVAAIARLALADMGLSGVSMIEVDPQAIDRIAEAAGAERDGAFVVTDFAAPDRVFAVLCQIAGAGRVFAPPVLIGR